MTPALGSTAGTRAEPRPTRRRGESRRRLVAAAREVFAERGIRQTPVELICERAGFTRGAFYSNFATKEDLFLEVFRLETEERHRRFVEALATVDDDPAPTDARSARETLAGIARAFVTSHAGDEAWFVLMMEFRLQAMRQPDLRPKVIEALQISRQALMTEAERFVARIGVRLAIDTEDAVRALLALYEAALEQNVLQGRPLTADNAFLTEAIPRMLAGFLDWDAPPRRAG